MERRLAWAPSVGGLVAVGVGRSWGWSLPWLVADVVVCRRPPGSPGGQGRPSGRATGAPSVDRHHSSGPLGAASGRSTCGTGGKLSGRAPKLQCTETAMHRDCSAPTLWCPETSGTPPVLRYGRALRSHCSRVPILRAPRRPPRTSAPFHSGDGAGYPQHPGFGPKRCERSELTRRRQRPWSSSEDNSDSGTPGRARRFAAPGGSVVSYSPGGQQLVRIHPAPESSQPEWAECATSECRVSRDARECTPPRSARVEPGTRVHCPAGVPSHRSRWKWPPLEEPGQGSGCSTPGRQRCRCDPAGGGHRMLTARMGIPTRVGCEGAAPHLVGDWSGSRGLTTAALRSMDGPQRRKAQGG